MSFIPKAQPSGGRIHAVTLGTGDSAIVIGGQNVLPFYTFDAGIQHPPKVGIEISDGADWGEIPGIADFYAGCATMAERAERAQAMAGADFLCLSFASADPNGENRPVADCVADARAVADAVSMPIVIMGCRNLEKDTGLFAAVSQALEGRNILCLSARLENCRDVGTSVCREHGHKVGAETADDISLAKQLNIILIKDVGVPADRIVMNIGTAAVGYGFEYVASTLDRIREAALRQSDADLQMPIMAPVSTDTWQVKESSATEEDEPAWGNREERGIAMEIATAAADLTCGADAVILRHPAAIATVKKFIRELSAPEGGHL